ncbi:MAG: outer membrane beta-barrel protein [Paludibacteraceae bacterium]|nr:outer membrane beta-barrel protein [Paludibacteraceae bacterium]
MKKITLILISLLVAVVATAQKTLSGTIVSKTDGQPIEMATVRLFAYPKQSMPAPAPGADMPNPPVGMPAPANLPDSILVQGAQTYDDGLFILSNVRPGKYKLIISSVGFDEHIQWVEMKGVDLDLRTIKLVEQVQHLAEVSVQGRAAEMTVKGDTIEYNTAAYQVAETATVEDLLKKMNGVEVDKEGNVTINGEEIKGVRIDGKKFFGDDVQVATKNIPADMIEKIQVIDEKSDMAKLTGFDDDEGERIINLSLKKDRKKGVFGNYSGALGADIITDEGGAFDYSNPLYGSTAAEQAAHFFSNDFRYNANVFTNILLGESQTTILAGANNTNEIRSGRGRGWFGGQNAGITASENIGVNTNIDFNSKIEKKDDNTSLILGGDATITHSNNDTRTYSNKESYSELATYFDVDSTLKFTKSWDAQMRLEMEYQIDSMNKIILRPQIGYTNTRYDQQNYYVYDRDSIRINDGYQLQNSLKEDIKGSMRLIYNHKFNKPGRTLTMRANLSFTNSKGNDTTYAWDNLQNLSLVNQYTLSNSNALSYSLRTSYVEPIYQKNHFLEMVLSVFGDNRTSVKDQYSYDDGTSQYLYDSDYSNNLINNIYSEQLELNYRWVSEKIDLTAGARVVATQTHSQTFYGGMLVRDTLYNRFNWSPNMRFKYNFGRKEFARIIYRGRVNQPTIQQMEPVRNNSDAMNETIGNLGLQPAFGHNIFAMYSRFNQDKFSSIMTGLRASFTQDALTNNTLYDTTGKRYNQTVNADMLPWNIGADFMSNTPFGNKMFQLHTRTAVSFNQRVAYILREQEADAVAQMIANNSIMLGDASRTGNLRTSNDITLRFTHQYVDIGIRNRNVYSLTTNSLNRNNITHSGDWSVTGDLTVHLPKSWNIATDIGFTARYGYTGLTDVNEVIWNASVDKTWNSATLTLKVYDILQDKKNIVQTVSDNSVAYMKYNTLPTYFMLTFTYKLNRMGGLKATGRAAWQQQMIESGGRPPMGPPPHF